MCWHKLWLLCYVKSLISDAWRTEQLWPTGAYPIYRGWDCSLGLRDPREGSARFQALQLPDHDGPRAWAPGTHVGDLPGALRHGHVEEGMSKSEFLPSPSFCLSIKPFFTNQTKKTSTCELVFILIKKINEKSFSSINILTCNVAIIMKHQNIRKIKINSRENGQTI